MPTAEAEAYPAALHLRVVDAVDDAEWERLLASDPRHHVAQHPEFQRVLAGEVARWVEVRDDEGALCAGMPVLDRHRGPFHVRVSGVLGTYGGPIAAPDAAKAEARIGSWFCERSLASVHLEMVWAHAERPRGEWPLLAPLPTAQLQVDPSRNFDAFLTEVFGRKGRKECNRSERRGLVATLENDGAAWRTFQHVLRRRSETWGTALPSPDQVETLCDRFSDVLLFAVRDDSQDVVGVHLVVQMSDELFAWVGSTARMEGVNPATLLLREEARVAHARGLSRVNLGSSLGIGGVQRYKEMLGAVEQDRWIVRWQPAWRRALRGLRGERS